MNSIVVVGHVQLDVCFFFLIFFFFLSFDVILLFCSIICCWISFSCINSIIRTRYSITALIVESAHFCYCFPATECRKKNVVFNLLNEHVKYVQSFFSLWAKHQSPSFMLVIAARFVNFSAFRIESIFRRFVFENYKLETRDEGIFVLHLVRMEGKKTWNVYSSFGCEKKEDKIWSVAKNNGHFTCTISEHKKILHKNVEQPMHIYIELLFQTPNQ